MLFMQCEEITGMKLYNYACRATSEELCICLCKGRGWRWWQKNREHKGVRCKLHAFHHLCSLSSVNSIIDNASSHINYISAFVCVQRYSWQRDGDAWWFKELIIYIKKRAREEWGLRERNKRDWEALRPRALDELRGQPKTSIYRENQKGAYCPIL